MIKSCRKSGLSLIAGRKPLAKVAFLFLLATPFCRSQDASCKAVADAQILLAKTRTM